MELKKQTVSLELAKKMKELGFEQESLFCWAEREEFAETNPRIIFKGELPILSSDVSAYTAAELGEMLPYRIAYNNTKPKDDYFLVLEKDWFHKFWVVFYGRDYGEFGGVDTYRDILNTKMIDKNEANARAKMLIYLKEEGLL